MVAEFDIPALAGASECFSGAEIEQAVIAALFTAYGAGKPLTTNILFHAVGDTVPLYRTMKEPIDRRAERPDVCAETGD